MALITCVECGKEISDKSNQCIGCGVPIIAETNEQGFWSDKNCDEYDRIWRKYLLFPIILTVLILIFVW